MILFCYSKIKPYLCKGYERITDVSLITKTIMIYFMLFISLCFEICEVAGFINEVVNNK